MHFVGKWILRVIVNATILWGLSYYLPHSVTLAPGWVALLEVALVMAIVHHLVRPVVKVLSFPFLLLTLGLFNIVINYALLWLADYFSGAITITGFKTRLISSIILGIVNSIF